MQRLVFALVPLWMVLNISALSYAQTVKAIGHFWAMSKDDGTVQILPGGLVSKKEDGRSWSYTYREGKFEQTYPKRSPKVKHEWTYFDWADVDYRDQIDKGTFDIPREAFLPKAAKVKKIIYIPKNNAAKVVALICYTVAEAEDEQLAPGATEIFLTALHGERKDAGYYYKKLWTEKLEKDSEYGDLTVQNLPGIDKVIVLYSAALGGSSEDRQLDIYLLQGFPI